MRAPFRKAIETVGQIIGLLIAPIRPGSQGLRQGEDKPEYPFRRRVPRKARLRQINGRASHVRRHAERFQAQVLHRTMHLLQISAVRASEGTLPTGISLPPDASVSLANVVIDRPATSELRSRRARQEDCSPDN